MGHKGGHCDLWAALAGDQTMATMSTMLLQAFTAMSKLRASSLLSWLLLSRTSSYTETTRSRLCTHHVRTRRARVRVSVRECENEQLWGEGSARESSGAPQVLRPGAVGGLRRCRQQCERPDAGGAPRSKTRPCATCWRSVPPPRRPRSWFLSGQGVWWRICAGFQWAGVAF
jgi:hypothetical protein